MSYNVTYAKLIEYLELPVDSGDEAILSAMDDVISADEAATLKNRAEESGRVAELLAHRVAELEDERALSLGYVSVYPLAMIAKIAVAQVLIALQL